jgi:integrase
MLKFLFYDAVRVSELVSIHVENVDLEQCKGVHRPGQSSEGPLHIVSIQLPPRSEAIFKLTRRTAPCSIGGFHE